MRQEREPFERVVAEHGATVLRVCRAILGIHDADDAWSETFLSALEAYPRLPDGANVQAWLVTIAHRKAVDVIRMRNRAPIPVADLPERPSLRGLPGAGDVWTAVAALPDRQRKASGCSASTLRCAPCRTSSVRPSPTTTSAGFPIARSPH